MTVRPEDEEVVRKAALLINERMAHYKAKYQGSRLPQTDILAFAAVDIAVKYLTLFNDNNTAAAEAEIESLAAEIRQYLNK